MEWVKPGCSKVSQFEYWISEPATTNNRMALRSVIEAFRGISKRGKFFRVVFTSDSKYIVEGMSSWVSGWMARGWRRKAGPIENLELWQQAVEAVTPHETQWKWVRGHNGQPQNEYANHLATRAAADQTDSAGLRQSEFDEWIALQKSTRLRLNEAEPFPNANSFRATPRAWTI